MGLIDHGDVLSPAAVRVRAIGASLFGTLAFTTASR